MNTEARRARSIKIRPSILQKAHVKAKEQGKWVGTWIEEAIEQRLERGKAEKEG